MNIYLDIETIPGQSPTVRDALFIGHIFDTMTAWAGVGNIDGSKVWDYVRTGRIADVVEYCKGDVERVRAIHRRMTFAEAA